MCDDYPCDVCVYRGWTPCEGGRRMTNRAPGTIWSIGPTPEGMRAYVRTADNDMIEIAADHENWHGWEHLVVDRHTARMIAKRINECLDATVKQ